MGFLDRFRGSDSSGGAASRADGGRGAAPAPDASGRLPTGPWPGVAPPGFPPSVDVDDPRLAFALNAKELAGAEGHDRLVAQVGSRATEPALAAYLVVVAAVGADLARRGLQVTALLVPEEASPWRALPFIPIVARAGGGPEVPVLVNPAPVTERETLAFLVFAGHARRARRFRSSPVAVYSPTPLPASFARLADAELPGLLEADLSPLLATRTPTPAEGARAFAEAVARRAKVHLDGTPASLAPLEAELARFPGARFGSVARVALAAYVGELAVARRAASWEGKLPLATLTTKSGAAWQPIEMARELLPAEGPPRLAEFVARAETGAA